MPKNDTIVIDFGEGMFKDFDVAYRYATEEYGYEGEAWDLVGKSRSLVELSKFLNDDGVDAYTV